ncbi:MAG: SoxR reducing system RseC family protein [Pseudomonadaceae bacterium]|nr:SoxR reducing system RseC family protein [Pseudomonadaceae bacterium]
MIEESGRVVALDEGAVWVQTLRKSTCSSCSANAGCGQGLLDKLAISGHRGNVRALTDLQLAVGDEVVIGVREELLLRSAVQVYLLPLLALLGGGFIAQSLELSEPLSILLGLGALLVAGLLVRWRSLRVADDPRLQPVVVRALLLSSASCSVP